VSIALSQTEDASLIRLEGAIDIGSAAELKAVLLDAVRAGKRIGVSLAQAGDIDVTAVQLLWAAKREAEQNSVAFELEGQPAGHAQSLLSDAGLDMLGVFSREECARDRQESMDARPGTENPRGEVFGAEG
jgi:anti-anti-sigma regulatory factor